MAVICKLRLYDEDILKNGSQAAGQTGEGEQWTFLDDYQKQVQISQLKYAESTKKEKEGDSDEEEEDTNTVDVSLGDSRLRRGRVPRRR